jgi:hypothetical protein
MTQPLIWNDGEGFDIHLVRLGPASKDLTASFQIDPQFPLTQFPLLFTPLFRGAPAVHGLSINTGTGEVTPLANPGSKLRNFLMLATQDITGQSLTFQTIIRFHIHDSVDKIWLTPSTLTVHTGFDECRFTVLAQFNDKVVGDITDWPQVSLQSADPNSVQILSDGKLSALPSRIQTDIDIDITATLTLANPVTSLPAQATASLRTNWVSLSRKAPVQFVDGPIKPDPTILTDPDPKSVESVVNAHPNILFIAEGFKQSQDKDFDKAVQYIVTKGLAEDILEPFKLLKGSINYWSLFLASQDDGISVLGEHQLVTTKSGQNGVLVPLPQEPASGQAEWSIENMIHQLGSPVQPDPVLNVADAITQWNALYTAPVTPALVATNFSDWNALRSRTILNERDSLFGISQGTRPRASDPGGLGDALLRPNSRRTKEATIAQFLGELRFGTPPDPSDDPFNIGEVWTTGQKDLGLVCFICLSDKDAGEDLTEFFSVTTGFNQTVRLQAATNGIDIQTPALSDPKAAYDPQIMSRRVAHECAHAFGLGDEYGPGNSSFVLGVSGIPIFPNLQVKAPPLVSAATPPVYDPNQIKWLLPRTTKIGVLAKAPVPDPSNPMLFTISFLPGVVKAFAKNDIVLVRQEPIRKNDPFSALRFTVDQVLTGGVEIIQQVGQPLDPNAFDPKIVTVLICTSIAPGVEGRLIGPQVVTWIGQSHDPLNAPPGSSGAACVPAKNIPPVMTPTNLPKLKFKTKPPPALADVLGLYEGGGHFDCGIFRPAGRCKMRTTNDKVIPFCQLCRYWIVDRVDPMKLVKLDDKYDPYYPL